MEKFWRLPQDLDSVMQTQRTFMFYIYNIAAFLKFMKCSNIFVKKEGRTLSSANTAYCVMDESKVMEQEKVPLSQWSSWGSQIKFDTIIYKKYHLNNFEIESDSIQLSDHT